MKEDTFSEAAAKFYIAELIQAVSSVHALGYIHRDLKPDNVLLGNTSSCNHQFYCISTSNSTSIFSSILLHNSYLHCHD